MPPPMDLIEELRWRGFIHQCTDEQGLREHLSGASRRIYGGFDPTSDSLTIGNLVPIMMLAHAARAGHEPIVVMGGGTGLIGDPSGKSAERQLLTAERVEQNVRMQRRIFANVFAHVGLGEPRILNNLDWLGKLGYIEVLRDVGKHFSVNMMMQKESIKERLHGREQGISYTEFSYMILQAYDFWWLYEHEDVSLQIGGSDQWGNIVGGLDFLRKRRQRDWLEDKWQPKKDEAEWTRNVGELFEIAAFGLTCPLVTKADGGKFGKSESGAVWLTAPQGDDAEGATARTSAYAMYQFWLNTADADVVRFLRLFTLLPRERIEELEGALREHPERREAQRELARHATAIVHGEGQALAAEAAARALFSGELSGISGSMLREVFAEAPSSEHERALLAGEGASLLEVLVETGLAESKKKGREFLAAGSVSVNGERADAERRLVERDLLEGGIIALRRGKKTWHVTRWR